MNQEKSIPFRTARALVAGLLIAVSSGAFGQMAMDKKDSMSGMGSGPMHGSMMKMSGDLDKDFAMMMKMHHQGAIDMAQAELKNDKDAKLQKMAKKIIAAQQKEIKEFDQWLAKHK